MSYKKTLRDEFAMAVVGALWTRAVETDGWDFEPVAVFAYKFADAMLEARSNEHN